MTILATPWVKRLLASLGGGFVLALMVGPQEGTVNGDFGTAFFQALGLHHQTGSVSWHFPWRLLIFLGIGVLVFLAVTAWQFVAPYLKSPGMLPLISGAVGVLVSQTVMNWFDPLGAGAGGSTHFLTLSTIVGKTSSLSGLTNDFFQWLSWVLLGAVVAVALVARVQRSLRALGYVAALLAVVGAVLAYHAHSSVVSAATNFPGYDHSLGVYVDVAGFLLLGAAGVITARSTAETADPKGFWATVLGWRPGLPLVGVGVLLGLFAYLNDAWFGPLTHNADFAKSRTLFEGGRVNSLAEAYLGWLGWTLFAAAAVLALAATYLANRMLAWLTVALGAAGLVITFLTLHDMTFRGFALSPNDGQTWGNIGAGGYSALLTFALLGVAGAQVLFVRGQGSAKIRDWANQLPVSGAVNKARQSAQAKSIVLVVIAVAVLYPPMLTVTWQNLLVTQIGVYVLLAIGLNVVVGWAGLLDLGYIAFYAIGSYTTAYFTGSLPKKPPSWLHLTPLATIPFAIVACLIAGVLLGAPTLRLRGDYLAIVTLGFGEIITVVATNNPFGITGGPIGPTVKPPRLNLFGIKVVWGQDNLPYWYLLLVLIAIVLILFYRLEGSRLGRAWAAIREDEVAAQASGVNTTRVKLLAFAIGASTSGLAGVFFATQVGYFDPTLFTLQFSILIVAYVVFGGMGSLQGAMAGAAVLTWLPQFLKSQVPTDDRPMWVGAAILAMMIFRPQGLLPAKRRKAELQGLDAPMSSETFAVPASEGL